MNYHAALSVSKLVQYIKGYSSRKLLMEYKDQPGNFTSCPPGRLASRKNSPEEALEIAEARAEIETGKGIKAEDVWRKLGI